MKLSVSMLLLIGSGRGDAFQPMQRVKSPRQQNTALITPSSSEQDALSAYANTADGAVMETTTEFFTFPVIEEIIPHYDSSSTTNGATMTELFGEAFGTFWIVGIGSIASMWASFVNPFMTLPQVAMIWSLAVMSAIQIATPLSGAHFNPAITIALSLFRKFEWKKVLPYCGAQVVGAMAGSAMSFGLFRNIIRGFESTRGLTRASSIASARVFGEYFDATALTTGQALGVEALGTALLTTIVFAITHERNSDTVKEYKIPIPFVVGSTVFTLINALAPFTQCGMNPARDFGPRIIAYLAGWTNVAFQDCWLYIAGPLIGAISGAALIDKVLYANHDRRRLPAFFDGIGGL